MLKKFMIKALALFVIVSCLLSFAACETKPKETEKEPQSQTDTENKEKDSETDSPATEKDPEQQTEPDPEHEKSESPEETKANDVIKKISGASDEAGIYSVSIELSDKAADKGTVEMVYYGSKGSPQKNSVVNTFRIEYYKDANGLFEINTFFDGEVYANYHKQNKVKVVNGFSANLRARNVIISYTPDGGETQEIYRADAEQFYHN